MQNEKLERRIQREKKTLAVMAGMYCRDHHGGGAVLCAGCAGLVEYAFRKIEKCPILSDKPPCNECTIHCYRSIMRERVRQVMRYSGPRMVYRHPVLALRHKIDGVMHKPDKSD